MKYSIYLIDDKSKGSYLSVKGKTEWKTKRIAIQHAKDIKMLIAKGRFPAIAVDVEDEDGKIY